MTIKELLENLRNVCKGMSKQEMFDCARLEHIWALGSATNEEAYMHEQNATAYRLLANEMGE